MPSKPWAGRGGWIWYERQAGGVPAAIELAKRYGMSWVCVKESDEGNEWFQTDDSELQQYRDAGLKIVAWVYAYGRDDAGLARAIIDLAGRFDGVIIDAEAELRNAEGVDRTRTEVIDGILGPVRDAIGWDYPLAVAPLPVAKFHGDLNYERWAEWGCDFLPQFYSNVLGAAFSTDRLFTDWASRFDMTRTYPVFGAYGDTGYSGDQGAQYPTLEEFAEFEALAAGYGCPGVSYWRLDTIDPVRWHFGDSLYAGTLQEENVSQETIEKVRAELVQLVAIAGGQEAAGDDGAGSAIRTAVNNIIAAEPRFGLEG